MLITTIPENSFTFIYASARISFKIDFFLLTSTCPTFDFKILMDNEIAFIKEHVELAFFEEA